MKHALLDGKMVHAEELTWENKKYIYTCPKCGKDLRLVVSSTENYPSHFRHKHRESCGSYNYMRQHSQQQCEEFQQRSDINTLVMSEGNPHSLTTSQRKRLRARGFLKMMGRFEMKLTEKALEVLGQYSPPVTPPVILPVKCPHCPRTFRNKHGLSIHIGKTHPIIPPFECPHCPREFETQHGLSIHIGKVHVEYLQPPPTLPIILPDIPSVISPHWDTIKGGERA